MDKAWITKLELINTAGAEAFWEVTKRIWGGPTRRERKGKFPVQCRTGPQGMQYRRDDVERYLARRVELGLGE